MGFDVQIESEYAGKYFWALVARNLFLLFVAFQVANQTGLAGQYFATEIANV